MSLETVEERRTGLRNFVDDYDILNYAKEANNNLKRSDKLFALVYSDVTKVDEGFYITPKLEIAIASIKHMKERKIPDDVLEDLYYGALSHENAHAVAFPFMTRMNLTYAVVHGYCKERGINFNTALFNEVENIISDVFNELVIFSQKIEGYKQLPKLRYYYIYLPDREKISNYVSNRVELEKNPVMAIFVTHTLAFASIYKGRLKTPKIPKPKWLSEYMYNSLYRTAKVFDVENHIQGLISGEFSRNIGTLINHYDMYGAADKLYTEIKTLIKSRKVRINKHDFWNISRILDKGLDGLLGQYWSYFTTLIALYRLTAENAGASQQIMKVFNVDRGKQRPAPPPPDILDNILKQMKGEDILSPELAEYVAKRLISTALLTTKTVFETVYRAGAVKIPWYRRPRGKIDPLSLLKPSVLDWKVQVPYNIPEYRKSRSSNIGVPDTITAIIDESGSTNTSTSILSPIIGTDTTVFDVERTTVMSLLYNVLRYTDRTRTTLIRFSSDATIETGSVKEIYERLRNIRSYEISWGGTEIESAVMKAVELHRDKPTNYFLLATDMEIEPSQARMIREIILSEIKRSPVLILAVNADIPNQLRGLNRYPNIAVVSVKTMVDYPKLENAIKKLARLLIR